MRHTRLSSLSPSVDDHDPLPNAQSWKTSEVRRFSFSHTIALPFKSSRNGENGTAKTTGAARRKEDKSK
jgi:hypothetical protein